MSTDPNQNSRYELQQLIEHEGNQETWKAFDIQQRRYVTIKIVHVNTQSATPDVIERFQREALRLTSLHHPIIAQMFDFQIVQPSNASTIDFWIVTDYIEGISLARYIQAVTKQGAVPPPIEVVRFLASTGTAIDYAHQCGIVHGNLNPANILLDKYGTTSNMLGEPKLLGFGAYGLQKPSELPPAYAAYISPEVAREQMAVPQSDIYSLGIILYQICTGFLPFQSENSSEIVKQHLYNTPIAPETLNQYIPATLTAVIMRALAKDPATRYATTTAMVREVAQALNMAIPERISQSHPQIELTSDATLRSAPFSQLPRGGNTGPVPRLTTVSSPGMPAFNPSSNPGIPTGNTPFPPINPDYFARPGAAPAPNPVSGVWSAANINRSQPSLPGFAPPLQPPTFPPSPPVEKQSRRRLYLFIGTLAGLLIILGGILAGLLILNQQQPAKITAKVDPIVGHAFFVSSGQVSLYSNVGIADQFQVSLQNLPAPSAGKNYYAWLLSDSKAQALPLPLGALAVQNGHATMFYAGDSRHSDILANYNRFLVTQEDINTQPVNYTLDAHAWIFGAVLSEAPNPEDTANHYSLLDHTRHLLAQDPKLKAAGLVGGLDTWLFRNTQKILEWSGSARDARDPAFMQRQIIRILDYLDGSQFVGTEKLPAGMPIIQVDPIVARVALLEIDPQQTPPGYLTHIGNHLREITRVPGVSHDQQALAIRITTAINNVEFWLQAVHTDAEKLIQMPSNQLLQPAASVLFNDMFTQANYAFIGQTDPNTLQVKEGVAEIHYNIQRLATFDVTSCTTSKTPCA